MERGEREERSPSKWKETSEVRNEQPPNAHKYPVYIMMSTLHTKKLKLIEINSQSRRYYVMKPESINTQSEKVPYSVL